MAYDAARGVTVLFGGWSRGNSVNAETWEWNGTAWTRRLVSGPSPRAEHEIAYDGARGVTVLFGGRTGTDDAETWELGVTCPADFNGDGFLDFFDYDDFVTAFETGGGLEADFNQDGFVDFFDYSDFVLAFETGC